jgi:hypothetical protein
MKYIYLDLKLPNMLNHVGMIYYNSLNKKIFYLNLFYENFGYELTNCVKDSKESFIYDWNNNRKLKFRKTNLYSRNVLEFNIDLRIKFCNQFKLVFGDEINITNNNIYQIKNNVYGHKIYGCFVKTFATSNNTFKIYAKEFYVTKNINQEIFFKWDDNMNIYDNKDLKMFMNKYGGRWLIFWNIDDSKRINYNGISFYFVGLVRKFGKYFEDSNIKNEKNKKDLNSMNYEYFYGMTPLIKIHQKSMEKCFIHFERLFTRLLYCQVITRAPICILWNNKNFFNISMDYLKYSISKDYNCVIPPTKKINNEKNKIERYLKCPQKGTLITDMDMIILDFDSFYPSLYLDFWGKNSNIIAHKVHGELIEKILRLKRNSQGLKKQSMKQLLNTYAFGYLGTNQLVFPSNKKLMLEIVKKGKFIMDNTACCLKDINIIYGITDSFLIKKTSLKISLEEINKKINETYKNLLLKTDGITYKNAFFINSNSYVLCTNKQINYDMDLVKGSELTSTTNPKIFLFMVKKIINYLMKEKKSKIKRGTLIKLIHQVGNETIKNFQNFSIISKNIGTSTIRIIKNNKTYITLKEYISTKSYIDYDNIFYDSIKKILKIFENNIQSEIDDNIINILN